VRLVPGSLPRVREWAAELNARRDEVIATLRDEGVRIESVFLEGETLVYFLKADSVDGAREVYAARSKHAIDAYHQRFKDETFAEQTQLELLIDFENL
jgi:hypothetical protein